MKILGVIPARYNSSRLPGKPLVDIHGKPMIWWTYQRAIQVKEFIEVIVATDDIRIKKVCDEFEIPSILTGEHENHILRVAEVATLIEADYYVCINGDEPLILPESIRKVIPHEICGDYHMGFLIRDLTNPVEVMDPGNIKVVSLKNGKCIYMSRGIVPYPKGTLDFTYKKFIGVECYNQNALEFYRNTEMGELERIEDIDHLRFIENNIPIHVTLVESDSLSVDTYKDLEKVKELIKLDN